MMMCGVGGCPMRGQHHLILLMRLREQVPDHPIPERLLSIRIRIRIRIPDLIKVPAIPVGSHRRMCMGCICAQGVFRSGRVFRCGCDDGGGEEVGCWLQISAVLLLLLGGVVGGREEDHVRRVMRGVGVGRIRELVSELKERGSVDMLLLLLRIRIPVIRCWVKTVLLLMWLIPDVMKHDFIGFRPAGHDQLREIGVSCVELLLLLLLFLLLLLLSGLGEVEHGYREGRDVEAHCFESSHFRCRFVLLLVGVLRNGA
ncbi:uncharacterized protein EV422DRAFT_537955 [Fimicolochytrium jonesii]|uniref:uncharacterized protein n=1 Tax=Fimicolochytrium jonesii TaxID=1396493 RepID=UPI0022FF14ED|nr:uncharacterized protein EV422DRAFT_537955 [Fimicolochytrium jonesii]KAI8818288.1 hypothetical protein EV422DRAFT_537955 [Fimicolochytrium jonesii]